MMESRDNPRQQQAEIDDQFGLNKITHFKIEDFLKPFEAQMATLKLGSLKSLNDEVGPTNDALSSEPAKNMLSGLATDIKIVPTVGAIAPNKPLILKRFDFESKGDEPGKFKILPDPKFDKFLLDDLEPYSKHDKND